MFANSFEDLRQGGIVHGFDAVLTNPAKKPGDGRLFECKPISFCGEIDISEADLLGRELQARATVRSLALLDEPLLVQEKEAAAYHDGAF